MDLDRFCPRRPGPSDGSQLGLPQPSARFHELLAKVGGSADLLLLQLLNWAVSCLEEGEVYCHYGCQDVAPLIGALLGHNGRRAYAADGFTTDRPSPEFLELLKQFGVVGSVHVMGRTLEEFFQCLVPRATRIGVYYYAGPHDYRSQLMGLLLARPHLAERAVIFVAEADTPTVKQATWDFLASHPESRLILELSPSNSERVNRVQVLSWERDKNYCNDWQSLWESYHQAFESH